MKKKAFQEEMMNYKKDQLRESLINEIRSELRGWTEKISQNEWRSLMSLSTDKLQKFNEIMVDDTFGEFTTGIDKAMAWLKSEGFESMDEVASTKNTFTKIAAKRAERKEELYSIDEEISAYSPNCPDHVAVRRELVGLKERRAAGYDTNDVVWKCPVDGKVFHAEGSVSEQTDGFASKNNLHRNVEPIEDGGFDAANKLAKAMGYDA